MLIYEKKVDNIRHIYGTFGNVPSSEDTQLSYTDAQGEPISPSLDATYLDDGRGGIKTTAGTKVLVYIGEERIIPAVSYPYLLIENPPTTVLYKHLQTQPQR